MAYAKRTAVPILVVLTLAVTGALAQESQSTPTRTLQARRAHAMQAAADAIVLIRSKSVVMEENEVGFRQDPAFFYLTGLANAVGALLVLDSRRQESWLFVPPPGALPGVGRMLHAPYGYVEPGSASAAQLGLDSVVPWGEFASFIDRRLAQDSTLVIRGPFRSDSAGASARLVGRDEAGLWGSALRGRWPHGRFGPAPNAEALRAIKDSGEIAVLRRVAASSGSAAGWPRRLAARAPAARGRG